MEGFISYIPGDSYLHRLHPLTKLFVAILLCIVTFVTQNHLFLFSFIVLMVLASYVAGVGERAWRIAKALFQFSLVFFLLQIFFVRDGQILLQLPFGVLITREGLSFSSLLMLRIIGATFPLLMVLSVTSITDLSNAMVEKLGLPYPYVFVIITVVRFIPVFARDMQTIMEVQKARGVAFDTKNPLKKISLILPLCVPLLISSVRRLHSNAISAELRGFHKRTRKSAFKSKGFSRLDALCGMTGLLLLTLGILS